MSKNDVSENRLEDQRKFAKGRASMLTICWFQFEYFGLYLVG